MFYKQETAYHWALTRYKEPHLVQRKKEYKVEYDVVLSLEKSFFSGFNSLLLIYDQDSKDLSSI